MLSKLERLQSAYRYYGMRLSPFALMICSKYDVPEHPFFLTIMYVLRHNKVKTLNLKRYIFSRLAKFGYTYNDVKRCIEIGYRCYVFDMDDEYTYPGERIKDCLSV